MTHDRTSPNYNTHLQMFLELNRKDRGHGCSLGVRTIRSRNKVTRNSQLISTKKVKVTRRRINGCNGRNEDQRRKGNEAIDSSCRNFHEASSQAQPSLPLCCLQSCRQRGPPLCNCYDFVSALSLHNLLDGQTN